MGKVSFVVPADRRSWFDRLRVVLPLAIFALALGMRLVGIGWGLKNDLHNASYHPDEPLIFGYSRSIVPGQGQFVPHFYNYGTLYLTILRAASDITTTYGGPPKVPEGKDGWSFTRPENTDWEWVSRCHLAGRVLSALAGAGTVLVVFLLGRRWISEFGAAIGAFALAIAPAHLVHSRFQTVDVLATFFLALSLYWATLLLPTESDPPPNAVRIAVWCGVFAGLSAGTKYTGILALFALYAAVVVARRPKAAIEAVAGTLAALVTFVITTPGALLDRAKFLEDFVYEMRHTSTGHELVFAGTSSGFLFHLVNLVTGFGPLIALIGLAGLGWAAWRRQQWAWVLLAFMVPYYLLIARAEVKFLRYTFPLYVGVAAGFGYAVAAGSRAGGRGRLVVGLGILGVGGVPFGGIRGAVTLTGYMLGEDPRDSSARFLRQDPIRVGFVRDPWYWSPPLFPDAAEPRSVPWERRFIQTTQEAVPPIDYVAPPEGPPTQFDLRLLTEQKPPRISLGSFEASDLDRLQGVPGLSDEVKAQVENYARFKAELDKSYKLEHVFGETGIGIHDLEYIQPVMTVWRRKDFRPN